MRPAGVADSERRAKTSFHATMNPIFRVILLRVAFTMAALGMAGWLGTFGYFAYLQSKSPGAPAASSNQIVELKNHGKRFYVTPGQDTFLQYGRIGSWVVLIAGIGMSFCVRPIDVEKKKKPDSEDSVSP